MGLSGTTTFFFYGPSGDEQPAGRKNGYATDQDARKTAPSAREAPRAGYRCDHYPHAPPAVAVPYGQVITDSMHPLGSAQKRKEPFGPFAVHAVIRHRLVSFWQPCIAFAGRERWCCVETLRMNAHVQATLPPEKHPLFYLCYHFTRVLKYII